MNWHEYFTYDDGKLIWKERPLEHFSSARTMKMWNTRYARTVAGAIDKDGYTVVGIMGKSYGAHRIVYEMFNSEFGGDIDHVDRDRSNNRVENLRPATKVQNRYNTGPWGAVELKGVCYDKKSKKYRAQIRINGIKKHLGFFLAAEDAADEYEKAAKKLHGEFFWR